MLRLMSDAVRYEVDDNIGIITLNRPDNRNSMTPELLDAFAVASARAKCRCLDSLPGGHRHRRVLLVGGGLQVDDPARG